MPCSVRLITTLIVPVSFAFLVGCGSPQPPPTESAATPAATPAGQAASSPDRAKYMDQHFAEVALVEQAVIRGDLEAAQGPARWIYEHQEIGGFPEAPHLALMKSAAKAVAEAAELNRAAEATGSMLVSCGTCHTEVGARPKMPDAPEPPAGSGTAPHMLEHQWAVDMMERGLVGPSDELWTKGAERLKAAPLTAKELPKDPKLTKEIIAFEASVHALAEKARQTPDPGGRAHVYGEILSSCGHCHSLHGQVWGPGLPKG